MPTGSLDHGEQPLHRLLNELGLDNAELVAASTEHLTHKQVQKGRKGRALTANLQGKITRALKTCTGRTFRRDELFTYAGR